MRRPSPSDPTPQTQTLIHMHMQATTPPTQHKTRHAPSATRVQNAALLTILSAHTASLPLPAPLPPSASPPVSSAYRRRRALRTTANRPRPSSEARRTAAPDSERGSGVLGGWDCWEDWAGALMGRNSKLCVVGVGVVETWVTCVWRVVDGWPADRHHHHARHRTLLTQSTAASIHPSTKPKKTTSQHSQVLDLRLARLRQQRAPQPRLRVGPRPIMYT